MKKFLVSLLVIITVGMSVPSHASASEKILNSNNVSNTNNISTGGTISPFTLYDWGVATYMDTSYRKVPGPSGNNGNFKLGNADGSHYRKLTVAWGGTYDVVVYLYNIGTGQTTSAKSSKYSVTFTNLVDGNYTVYARKTSGSASISFRVTTSDPSYY